MLSKSAHAGGADNTFALDCFGARAARHAASLGAETGKLYITAGGEIRR